MMTARSEYRLLLRQDNADLRLTPLGYELGLISEARYQSFLEKKKAVEREVSRLKTVTIPPTPEVNGFLDRHRSANISTGVKLSELLKRPELDYESLAEIDPGRPRLPYLTREQAGIQIKYEGYIKRQLAQAEQFKKLESKALPPDIDYTAIRGLRLEARQKLNQIKPTSVGQASRISGVSPSDISVLLIYLEAHR